MRLRDFMTLEVESIHPKETMEAAYDKMRRGNFRHLVVLDDGRPVGILSERDIGLKLEPELRDLLVEDVMSEPVVHAGPNTTVREAANLMRGHTVGCLPIMDHGSLVGIVTTTDLLELLGRGIERVIPEAEPRPVSREHPGRNPAGLLPD